MQTLEGWKKKEKLELNDALYLRTYIMYTIALFTAPQAGVPAYLRRRRQRFLFFFAATIEASYGCSVSSQREYTPTESNPPGPAEMNALGEQKGNPPEKWDGEPKKKEKKKKVGRQNFSQ